MTRSRILTYSALAFPLLALSVPHVVFGAGFPSIVPQTGSCVCPGSAPDWGCILLILQNVINAAIYLGVTLCVVWIAVAGFTLMVSGDNPEARSLGKTRILNAVIGIAIILCSWIVIDFVMKMVYEPSKAFDGGSFGPWNSILAPTGDDYCIRVTTPSPIFTGTIGVPKGGTPGSNIGVAKGLCADSNTSCSPAVMKKEGLTDAQANAMSCIAVTESGGGSNKGNSGTGAQGLFQITGQNWRNSAFHRPPCSAATSRLDDRCNRQAAVLMYKQQGYQPWTGKCYSRRCGNVTYGQYWNPNAVACVAKYDPQ